LSLFAVFAFSCGYSLFRVETRSFWLYSPLGRF
jgi:hypothetical protein